MSLYIASLNSGSNGNCYYIGNEDEAIFIDAGISCRETEQRMNRLNLPIQKIKAIFISHEHDDHIKGVETLSHKYQIPVYITHDTLSNSRLRLKSHHIASFEKFTPVVIGNMSITAFPKFHDAINPHSFIISCNEVHVGVFTDIGRVCKDVIRHFQKCHAAFLESNYDEYMLMTGSYPVHLKNRIRNGHGHLSNVQALHLFETYRPAHMTHLFLSHLSHHNNSPDLVSSLFKKHTATTEIIIASRKSETSVFHIRNLIRPTGVDPMGLHKQKPVQLSLFNH